MGFIGRDMVPAPKLKEAILSEAELIVAYDEIVEIMSKLYNEARLVHADLSEYNILWYEDKCWIIDVAQSVEPSHPGALEFLMRDCDNISTVSIIANDIWNLITKSHRFLPFSSLPNAV
jgi:RIO kinase 3